MNAYTLAQQDIFDDTEAPPIKYTADGKISKDWTRWNFFVNRKQEINNPEPDYRTGFQQDYLKQNPY